MPPKKKPKGKPKGKAPGGGSGAATTVGAMLAALGVTDPEAAFGACANFEDEFRVVKKAYLKIVLKEHPDKGGDRERFEAVQTAWETLSSMKAENKLGSLKLAKTSERSAAKEHAHAAAHRPSSTPDWSFYAEAFKDSGLPLFKVERAATGRSKCEMRNKEATETKKAVKRRAHTVCRAQAADPKSACFISKNAVRVGTMDVVSGAYGRFVHLECWRVPASVYKGLPSPTAETNADAFKAALAAMEDVALAGARDLDDEGMTALARHVMDPEHWARAARKRLPDEPGAADPRAPAKKAKKASSKKEPGAGEPERRGGGRRPPAPAPVPVPLPRPEVAATVDLTASSDDEDALPVAALLLPDDAKKKAKKKAKSPTAGAGAERSVVVAKKKHASRPGGRGGVVAIPRPGVGLANPSAFAGKTVVLTGVFPELGGGAGLNLGKDRARTLIESFGGRVTSAVSGRTDALLVGREPGMSKVSQARARGATLLNFSQLCQSLDSGACAPAKGSSDALALTNAVDITSFSSGYWGNGLAIGASDAALAYAARGGERVASADAAYGGGKKSAGRKPFKALGW
jgi:hypothetical protein